MSRFVVEFSAGSECRGRGRRFIVELSSCHLVSDVGSLEGDQSFINGPGCWAMMCNLGFINVNVGGWYESFT